MWAAPIIQQSKGCTYRRGSQYTKFPAPALAIGGSFMSCQKDSRTNRPSWKSPRRRRSLFNHTAPTLQRPYYLNRPRFLVLLLLALFVTRARSFHIRSPTKPHCGEPLTFVQGQTEHDPVLMFLEKCFQG